MQEVHGGPPRGGEMLARRMLSGLALVAAAACAWAPQSHAQATKELVVERSREHDVDRLLGGGSLSVSRVIELDGGGYAVAGYLQDDRAMGRIDRAFVTIGLDERGDVRWKYQSDRDEPNEAKALARLGNGGVVAAGDYRMSQGWVIPLDKSGTPFWNRSKDPVGVILRRRGIQSAAVLTDGSIAVGGQLDGSGGVTLLSPVGHVTSERSLGYKDDTWVVGMTVDSGDLLGAGYAYFRETVAEDPSVAALRPFPRIERETDVVAFRMKPSGELVWNKRFTRPGMEVVTAVARTPTGIVVGGRASSAGNRNYDVFLQFIDRNGDSGERAVLDHNNAWNEVGDLRATSQGVLVAATTQVNGQNGVWMFLFNAAGEIAWQAARAAPAKAMTISSDGRVVVVAAEGGKLKVQILRAE